jgi:hypothetical protein
MLIRQGEHGTLLRRAGGHRPRPRCLGLRAPDDAPQPGASRRGGRCGPSSAPPGLPHVAPQAHADGYAGPGPAGDTSHHRPPCASSLVSCAHVVALARSASTSVEQPRCRTGGPDARSRKRRTLFELSTARIAARRARAPVAIRAAGTPHAAFWHAACSADAGALGASRRCSCARQHDRVPPHTAWSPFPRVHGRVLAPAVPVRSKISPLTGRGAVAPTYRRAWYCASRWCRSTRVRRGRAAAR